MRYAAILTGFILWAGAACAQGITAGVALPEQHRQLEAHVVGRVVETALPDGGTAYVHQWPGVYFEAAFEGSDVFLAFDDPHNKYSLHIDGQPFIIIDRPNGKTFAVTGMVRGKHSVRLEKVTESILNRGSFKGFHVAADAKTLPVAARPRQIEFIGDSGAVGYGNRSTTVKCTPEEVANLTDTQAAWPALTAKHFNADYQVNAISGRGVVRNYNGTTPGYTMPDVYPYTFFDKTVPYADPDWQPQIVVVALGGNDMTPLQPGEPWTTPEQLGEALIAGYARLVVSLHQRYPSAAIVMQWQGPTGDAATDQAVEMGRQAIEAAAQAAGLKTLGFMVPPKDFKVDLSGCDYHGSLAGHKTAADWAVRWLKDRPELWQGR